MATVFVGGSALLLAGAMASLAFGFANGEEPLVWIALLASGAAAVFLVIAYVLSRRDLRRASRSAPQQTDGTEPARSEPVAAATAEPPSEETDEREQEAPSAAEEGASDRTDPSSADAAPGPQAPVSPGSPTATKPSTVKKGSGPGTAAAAKPSSPTDPVVGIASKKKFHRPECRYAKSESAEDMTRAAARRRGFNPCGICKP